MFTGRAKDDANVNIRLTVDRGKNVSLFNIAYFQMILMCFMCLMQPEAVTGLTRAQRSS